MTAKETERLAKVEQKVDDLKENVDRGFDDIQAKLDGAIARMDNMNKSFVTVAQAKAAGWLLGFMVSVVTLAYLIIDHIKAR